MRAPRSGNSLGFVIFGALAVLVAVVPLAMMLIRLAAAIAQ